jgi:Fic family protein
MARTTGRYRQQRAGDEKFASFVPYPLPPREPPLVFDDRTHELLRDAEQKLTRLDLAGEMVPSLQWFIYGFVRKEAVVSSQIEGTQATLIDLLNFEAGASSERQDRGDADVREVCNYLDAVLYARKQLAKLDGLPISMRLLSEAHRRLMKGVRGADKQPGEVRRSQNWIGGTRPGNAAFVPPPPEELATCLNEFEKYIHSTDALPPLVRAGLVHVQFETIHPYLDGNGRIGRLLVALLLQHWKLLPAPLLYLSLYFKRHRAEYYRRLDAVRREGDWEGWTTFFLDGVSTIAEEAVGTARELFGLVNQHRSKLLAAKKASVMAVRLLDHLPEHPILTIDRAAKLLKTTLPTTTKAIGVLEDLGILVETTGRRRDRAFSYRAYLDRLRAGTELEARDNVN